MDTATFGRLPLSDNAGERAAPRRQQRYGRPGVPEPGVAVPQPVSTEGVPDPNPDHAGPGGLSNGPGESHPGRQLRGSGSHHVTQGPALLPLLGRFLCSALWTDRSSVMEEAALSCDHILHAAVSSLCDAQPGGLHPLLPECSAGQLTGGLSAGETTWTLTLPQKQEDGHLNKSFNLAIKVLSSNLPVSGRNYADGHYLESFWTAYCGHLIGPLTPWQ